MRLHGHALIGEGVPHDDAGRVIGLHFGTSGPGRAKCECGALSPKLASGRERKDWHRQHKALVAGR